MGSCFDGKKKSSARPAGKMKQGSVGEKWVGGSRHDILPEKYRIGYPLHPILRIVCSNSYDPIEEEISSFSSDGCTILMRMA